MYYNIQKRRILLHFFILLLFAFLQGLFFRFFDFFWGNINFVFLYFIFLSFYLGKSAAYKFGFVFGLILDCFGATYGFYALIFTLTGYAAGLFSGKFNLHGILLPVLFSAVVSLFYFILTAVLIAWVDTIVWRLFFFNAAVQLALNLVFAPLFALLFRRWLFRRVGIVENGK